MAINGDKTGWQVNTYADKIDVVPRGEEHLHIAHPQCECGPEVEHGDDLRLLIYHKSYDRREEFEEAAVNLPQSYQRKLAA